jgi:hypothetical protein
MQTDLQKHLLATYFSLRFGIFVIAVVFPLLLWLGGCVYVGVELQDSMSAYYHAAKDGRSMRDWFVGVLFSAAICLYVYKGYSRAENYALNFAAAMAVGVAIFPMSLDSGSKYSIHGVCAVLFFIAIAFVCVFCADDTLDLKERNSRSKKRYERLYRSLAAVMIISPVIAFILNATISREGTLIFFVEMAGILAFASYWLAKTIELRETQADISALTGKATRGADGRVISAAK